MSEIEQNTQNEPEKPTQKPRKNTSRAALDALGLPEKITLKDLTKISESMVNQAIITANSKACALDSEAFKDFHEYLKSVDFYENYKKGVWPHFQFINLMGLLTPNEIRTYFVIVDLRRAGIVEFRQNLVGSIKDLESLNISKTFAVLIKFGLIIKITNKRGNAYKLNGFFKD